MRTFLCLLVSFVGTLSAQDDPLPPGGGPTLHDLLDRCRTALGAATPTDPTAGEATLWRLVGHLRAGDPVAAEHALPNTAPWSVLGIAVLHGTLHRPPLAASRLQDLAAELEQPAVGDDRSFTTAARRIQAHLALAELAEAAALAGIEPPGPLPSPDDQRDLACAGLVALEGSAWQPGLGYFRSRHCHGELLLPDEAEVATLLPASLAAFWPNDERLRRHHEQVLSRTLAQPRGRGVEALDAAARQLGIACDLGWDDARERAFANLLAALPTIAELDATPLPPATAGRVLDAVAYAVTGATVWPRPAANAWTRLRPWLPPGATTLRFGPVLADGTCFTLHLAARPDHVAFTLVCTDTGGVPRLVVVDGATWPAVHLLHRGERCRGSLPRAQADADDDLHALDDSAGRVGGSRPTGSGRGPR